MTTDTKIIGNKYEIHREIASGAFGTVYLAYHKDLDRYTAIKALHAHYSQDPNFRARFLREAKALAKLNHENIVSIYDIIEESGIYYIVMEYVDGISLYHYLNQKGRLALDEAIDIVLQIANGLEHAHQFNIVHRDIKCQNILFTKTMRAKITDFGIVAAADEASLTLAGQVVGTPRYMSPEQAMGEEVDARSDIYSLGIVFYELLMGSNPFGHLTSSQVLHELFNISKEVELSDNADLPDDVMRLIRHMLEKDKNNRIETCSELISELLIMRDSFRTEATVLFDSNATTITDQAINKAREAITIESSIDAKLKETHTSLPETKIEKPVKIKKAVSPELSRRIVITAVTIFFMLGVVIFSIFSQKTPEKTQELPVAVQQELVIKDELAQFQNTINKLKTEYDALKDSYTQKQEVFVSDTELAKTLKEYNTAQERLANADRNLNLANDYQASDQYGQAIASYEQAIEELNLGIESSINAENAISDIYQERRRSIQSKIDSSRLNMQSSRSTALQLKANKLSTTDWKKAENNRNEADRQLNQAATLFDEPLKRKDSLSLLEQVAKNYSSANKSYVSSIKNTEQILQDRKMKKEQQAKQEAKKRTLIQKPITSDYEIISNRLRAVEKAYEARNLNDLMKFIDIPADKLELLQYLFSNFQVIEVSISSLDLTTNTAKANLTIDHLINAKNEATIPGKFWKTSQLLTKKSKNVWEKFSWQ